MRKDATYKQKFEILKSWLAPLVTAVKKELKNDHLKRDAAFCKRYIPGKIPAKLTDQELVHAYSKAIDEAENGEEIAEFIANRWLLKHGDIYSFFEEHLRQIYPNFTELEQIDEENAQKLSTAAVKEFGAYETYMFSILNSVVFSETILHNLAKQAQIPEVKSIKEDNSHSEEQLARLVDKYEKKLAGLQKKYVQDTEALKKQLAQLQRKLALK